MRFLLLISFITLTTLAQANDGYFTKSKFVMFQILFGQTQPDADSDIYRLTEEDFTFSPDDLDDTTMSVNIYIQLNNFISMGGGFSFYENSAAHEDRIYEFDDGSPIRQATLLENNWFGANVMVTPFGAGEMLGSTGWAPKKFVPYATLGIGIGAWEFSQRGDFVETDTLLVRFEDYRDKGNDFIWRWGAGLRINLTKFIDLDFNYTQANGDDALEGDFVGFGDLDLSSKTASLGVMFRF